MSSFEAKAVGKEVLITIRTWDGIDHPNYDNHRLSPLHAAQFAEEVTRASVAAEDYVKTEDRERVDRLKADIAAKQRELQGLEAALAKEPAP